MHITKKITLTNEQWNLIDTLIDSQIEVASDELKRDDLSKKKKESLSNYIDDLTELGIDMSGDDEEE